MSASVPIMPVLSKVPSSTNAWRTVTVLTALYWWGTLDRQVSALLVPQIKADLHLTDFELSMIQGLAFGAAYLLASPITGWLVDRYNRRKILFTGAAGWSLSAMACGLSRSFGQLFCARAGVGGFETTLNPTSYSMLSDLFPPSKLALPISIYVLGGNLGSGMSFLVGGAVIAWVATSPQIAGPFFGALADWQMAFIVTGAPGLLLAPLVFLARDPRRHASSEKRSTSTYADLWRHMRRYPGFFITHLLGFSTIMAIVVGLQSWNAAYVSRTFAWPVSKIGFVFGSVQLTSALAGLAFHGWVVDKLFAQHRKDAHLHYFMIMTLLALPCAVSAYLVQNAVTMIVLYNLAYFFVMAFASIGPAALQIATPQNLRGKASSIYMIALTIIGTILGPAFVAMLTDFVFADEALLGYAMALFSLIACGFAALLFALGRSHMRHIVADMLEV